MSWIEIIHVRNPSSTQLAMVQDFITSIQRSLEREGLSAFTVYTDAMLPGDIAIHLCWSGDPPARDGSIIGKRIVYQFQQHTTAVRHSVWKSLENVASQKIHIDAAGPQIMPWNAHGKNLIRR